MPSKANIAGHPLHPTMVAFPVVFFIAAFVLDIVYKAGGAGADYSQFAYILIIAGIATALASAITGLMEYSIIVDEETKQIANAHMGLNVLVLLLEAVNLGYRGRSDNPGHFWKHGWILSLVSVAILSVSGWLGQSLVYNYRMGHRYTGPSTTYA